MQGSDNVKKALEKIEKYDRTSMKLAKIDELMQKEFSSKGSDLISLVEQRKEGRTDIVEKELNLKTLDHKIKVVGLSEKANEIKAKCDEDINKFNEKRFRNNILGAVRKIWVHKVIPRTINLVAEGTVKAYRSVANSPRNFITGGKDKLETKGEYTSASAPVEKLMKNKLYVKNVVNDAKKARKVLKQFKKIESTKDLESFVTKFKHMVPDKNDSN